MSSKIVPPKMSSFVFRITCYWTAIILFICVCCITFASGFHYEEKKFKAMLITLVIVLLYQFLVADILLFLLRSAWEAIFQQHEFGNWEFDDGPSQKKIPTRMEFVRRKLDALKSQLELQSQPHHLVETVNITYSNILKDLKLFTLYFFFLLLVVVGSRDPFAYYRTNSIRNVLENPKFSQWGTKSIVNASDLYEFINGTLIEGFNNGKSYNGKTFDDPGWINLQMAKLLGVVRLRQIRHRQKESYAIKYRSHNKFDERSYMPEWKKPFIQLPYMEKYWRIYDPWKPGAKSSSLTSDTIKFGELNSYSADSGYIALLGRTLNNSRTILHYLRKHNWIDSHTAALIIEFTLYNVDADIFNEVTILCERTPFGTFVTSLRVETSKLLINIENLPWYELVTLLLYVFVLVRFVCDIVLRRWYSSTWREFFENPWNSVDILIVLLNAVLVLAMWMREHHVTALIRKLESAKKDEFIGFHTAAQIDDVCSLIAGLLVCLATVRIWKILQFSTVFQVLTKTLYSARDSLASTTFFIVVFLVAIGMSSNIINGNNAENLTKLVKSLTSLMCLSFGFSGQVSPNDLNYGGSALGFLLYTILMIVVSIFLINMFITVVCLHFAASKEEQAKRAGSESAVACTFWEFLGVEYSPIIRKFKNGFSLKRSAQDKIHLLRLRGGGGGHSSATHDTGKHRHDRMKLISDVLVAQMELLNEAISEIELEQTQNESPAVEATEIPVEKLLTTASSDIESDKPTGSAKNLNKHQVIAKGRLRSDLLVLPTDDVRGI